MHGLPTGTFLIRETDTSLHNNFILSVKDGKKVRHYKIHKGNDEKYSIAERGPFNSLHDLVAHFMEDSDGLVCKLVLVCPGKTVSVFEHTCTQVCAPSYTHTHAHTHTHTHTHARTNAHTNSNTLHKAHCTPDTAYPKQSPLPSTAKTNCTNTLNSLYFLSYDIVQSKTMIFV